MNSLTAALSLSVIAFQGPSSQMPEDYWRNPQRCGINCLYGYMNLHGKDCELKDIARHVKLGVEGASLHDLQRAATDMGVPSSVVKITNTELSRVPLPAIAHFDVRGGHYQLLLEVNPDTVTTADMSSGEIKELPRNVFLETWSGYLLISGTSIEWRTVLWRSSGLALICLGVVRWVRASRRERIAK
jgi:ABC-type bacteriocin/lantibiotic exporter with double-glycine peptidase domain